LRNVCFFLAIGLVGLTLKKKNRSGFFGRKLKYFANLYNSMANYQSSTYGAQVGAISRQPSGAEQFGQIATGLGNLIKI
jgi:hypothetical protein